MQLISYITSRSQISQKSIQNTIELLNEDCTIPFISRYRKEKTGNLNEVEIGEIVKLKEQFEVLEKRKVAILKALKEQEVLTGELTSKINNTEVLTTLEDIYLPYKKKRKTKAEAARKNGLEPLAKMIMSQRVNNLDYTASKYTSNEVKNSEQALEGARFIIAEWINERNDIRNNIRYQLERFAQITTKVITAKNEDEEAQKFKDYFDWSESLNRIPSHRFLAILRAENEGFIRVKIEIDKQRALQKIEERIIRSQNECTNQIELAIKDAYKRLLFPSLSNEALSIAKEKADESAIKVFTKNLQQLLLGAPLGEKRILAIDPGFRSGCKVVCLNAQGDLLQNETIFPHAPQNKDTDAIKKISSLTDAYKIEAIAIGNGTASRETEQLIKRIHFKNKIEVFVVSEAGASIYSASKIARDEFPNYDVTVRGSVSIGRRLADPLAELVKIDAKSIGVGQYQHDVSQSLLKSRLDGVVESCVNTVGINVNTASKHLLTYVSGLGERLAQNIVEYRAKNGSFKSRKQLMKVPRMGDKAYEQSAGFLRIRAGKNALDNTGVHPETYSIVEQMAADLNCKVADLIQNKSLRQQIQLRKYTTKEIGLPTLQDILKELDKPGLDPRGKAQSFSFSEGIESIGQIREGMTLNGIITNITKFGAFVDIGIKVSGLIHVSQMADRFVSDPMEVVKLNQQVQARVIGIDIKRERIQLSLKS